MRTAAICLCLLLLPGLLQAQTDPRDREIFGDPTEVEPATKDEPEPSSDEIVPSEEDRDRHILGDSAAGPSTENRFLLDRDRLQIGGFLYSRYTVAFTSGEYYGEPDRFTRISNPNLLDLYLDGRPNDRIRAYIRGRMSYDPVYEHPAGIAEMAGDELPAVKQVDTVLDQLWLKFDIARRVFVTVGKQPVRFGATRLWNPVDVLNPTRRDPLAFFDERTGLPLVKLAFPVERLGWNVILLALLDGADKAEQVGGAGRLEMVFGTAEIGLTGVARKDTDPKGGIDLSIGVGDIDLTAEAGFTHDEERSDTLMGEGWVLEAAAGLSWGIRYGDEDTLYLGGEYFYNPDLSIDKAQYVTAFTGAFAGDASGASAFRPFYLGEHYGAVFVSLPAPGSWDDVSFTLTTLGNMSDRSFITRFDTRIVVLTYLSLETYIAGYYGQKGGEFRFGFDELTMPDPAGGDDLVLPISYPYPLIDVGMNLKVVF